MKQALFILVLLGLLLLSGCSPLREGTNDPKSGNDQAISNEKITLTAFQYELDNQAIDFPQLWFYRKLEEKTNVHVEFTEVKGEDWSTKLDLMVAAGELTDLIIRGTVDVEKYGVTQGTLVPLDDYLQEYMPNYASRLPDNGAGDAIPASDGKSYYVGFLISQDINVNGHFFINQNWLAKLGLSVPETVEELTDVLRAFRDGDPNGNGKSDEVPYIATMDDNNSGVYNLFAFFGVPLNEYFVYIDTNDTVCFAPAQEGYRECVEWMHLLYQEGLMDRESFTQSQNVWVAKINTDAAGFFSYWRLSNTSLRSDIVSQFCLLLPVAAEGCKPAVSCTLEVPQFGAALTVANAYIPQSLQWLDAQFETETMMVSQNGPLGDTLIINDEGKYEVAYVPSGNELYDIVPVICGQFFAPADYYSQVYTAAAHRIEKKGYCDIYTAANVMEYKSYYYLTELAPVTSEQSGRLSGLAIDIQSAMDDAMADMVLNGVTDEKWAQFTASFEDLGVNEYIAMYQSFYDNYRTHLAE